jgi:hypothetical protein
MAMRMPRHGIWFVAGGCVAALAILAAVLFLIPAAAPPPPVQITSIDWQIQQVSPPGGGHEFAELWINQSGPYWGFPFHLPAGQSFNDSLVLINEATTDVTICGASISPPLYIVSTYPAFPMVAGHSEDSLLVLTLAVHADPGATVNATGSINAVC